MDILNLFVENLPSLLLGLSMTLKITIVSIILSIIIGLIVGLVNVGHKKIPKFCAMAYIDIIRGTPLIVQAFFIYFGIPSITGLKITAFTAGVIAISFNAGAYMAEIFRAGILSIDKGQMEAARSLGLPLSKSMTKVILPQAIRKMAPAFLNQFIISLKDTSILSVIGIRELTQSGEIVIASNYKAFEMWMIVGLLYFAVIMALSYVSRRIERRLQT